MGVEYIMNILNRSFSNKKQKAKTNKKTKAASIIFVPHYQGQKREYKIYYPGRFLACVLFLAASLIVSSAMYIINLTNKNRELKQSVMYFYQMNQQQTIALNEKRSQLSQLKQNEMIRQQEMNDLLQTYKQLISKYKYITEKYVLRQTGSLASRSGDRNDSEFIEEINELRVHLANLNEVLLPQMHDNSILAEADQKIKEYLESIPDLLPVFNGTIGDGFGYRRDPFTRQRKFHEGIDIPAPHGTDIKAAASGKVIYSGKNGGYGNMIILDHGYGITTLYAHASKLIAKTGHEVSKGQVIAKVGSTGRSTGPHLHFEIRVFGTPVDPMKYLKINK